jgi:hypothetical protein
MELVRDGWYVFVESDPVTKREWAQWAGPFHSADAAEIWIGMQTFQAEKMRVGRNAVVWARPHFRHGANATGNRA